MMERRDDRYGWKHSFGEREFDERIAAPQK